MTIDDFDGTYKVGDIFVIPSNVYRDYYPAENDDFTMQKGVANLTPERDLVIKDVQFTLAGECAVSQRITWGVQDLSAVLVLHKQANGGITGTFLWLKDGVVVDSGIWRGI